MSTTPPVTPHQAAKDFAAKAELNMAEVRAHQAAEAAAKGGDAPPPAPPTNPPPATPATPEAKGEIPDAEKADIRKAIDEGKWPRSAVEWDKFKRVVKEDAERIAKERDDFKVKFEEADGKIKSFKPEVPKDYEQIKKERDEFDQRLRRADIRNHPAFQQEYSAKTGQQISIAKSIVGKDNEAKIERLLQLPDSEYKTQAIEAIVEALPVLQQSRLGSVINNLEAINQEREATVERYVAEGRSVSESQQQQASQRQEQQKQFVTRNLEVALTDAQKTYDAFKPKDGDVEWNSTVASRTETVRNLVTGKATLPELIKTTIKAVAYDHQAHELAEARREIASLNESIKTLKGASPTITPRGEAPKGEAPNVELKKGMTPHDAAKAFSQKVQGDWQRPGA